MNELYHHGVKGQKWGVRRCDKKTSGKSKKHLMIDESGTLRISDKNTTKKGLLFLLQE